MTNRFWASSLLAAFVIALAGSAGLAMPSLGGPTGIVSVPTAAVAPVGELQTAITYQSRERCAMADSLGMYGGGQVDEDIWALNLLAGVSREAELWAAYAYIDQDTPTESVSADLWAFGAKYMLASEPEEVCSLAIGGGYGAYSDLILGSAAGMYAMVDDVDCFNLYLVATKDFTPMSDELWEWEGGGTRILGSLGIMYIDVSPDCTPSEDLTELFLGLEFVGAGGTSLGLEYRFEDDVLDQDDVFSAVLSHRFDNQVELQVGTTNAGPCGLGLDDQDFFVRVGYDFPMGG
jgi:hypothetical protein